MKKTMWFVEVLAIVLTFAFAFTGCDTATGGNPIPGGDDGPKPVPGTVVLEYLSNQSVVNDYQFLGAAHDTKAGYVKALYKIGSIDNQLITSYSFFRHDGYDDRKEFTLSEITESVVSSSVFDSVQTVDALTVSAGVGIDIITNIVGVSFGTSYQSGIITSKSYASYSQLKTTHSFTDTTEFKLASRPAGWYRYGAFAAVDYYAEVLINPITKEVAGKKCVLWNKRPA
ncbi:hypothetical protein AGMMS49944_25390 [Spirochaetia bacterium]|nr:hypothetical protein AGMMS49944_25390 [Spirochaetia bacterium]